jgi:zinc-ribbon domain
MHGVICKHCHEYIPEDSRFCPKCGARLWIPPPANRPWQWIVALLLFAVIWSVVFRNELKVQLLDLRAQVSSALELITRAANL